MAAFGRKVGGNRGLGIGRLRCCGGSVPHRRPCVDGRLIGRLDGRPANTVTISLPSAAAGGGGEGDGDGGHG